MCCIAGVIQPGGDTHKYIKEVEAALYKMQSRGPDDLSVRHIQGAVLGHCRLAIVDPEGGAQPLSNEDQTVWAVVNGEIYNYPEKRRLLEDQGHVFKTASDSEVVIHLYEEYGLRMLEQLDGMFAFVLWDAKNQRLLAARDPMGQKPLYYFVHNELFAFASELKGLLKMSFVPKDVSRDSIATYLLLNYIPAPQSMIKDIRKLEGGHALVMNEKVLKEFTYYTIPLHTQQFTGSKEEAVRTFWKIMDKSVQKRLLADVPLGVFLSGGIDSTIILASLTQFVDPERINAFSIGFTEDSYDESPYARAAAQAFNVPLNIKILRSEDVLEVFGKLGSLFDEPVSDNSFVPTYLLAEFARKQVKTVLSGDGGDELFFGYPTFNAEILATIIGKIPCGKLFTTATGRILLYILGIRYSNLSPDYKIARFIKGLNYNDGARHLAYLGALSPDEVSELVPGSNVDYAYFSRLFPATSDHLKALSGFYLRTYLQEDVLVKVDRATMAASLEARAPFLDREMIRFAFSLPDPWVFSMFQTKPFLREALSMRLKDPLLLKRPKKGFGLPVAQWFTGPLKGLLEDTLSPDSIKRWELLNPKEVQRLLEEHLSGRKNHRMILFSLLVLQQWMEENL